MGGKDKPLVKGSPEGDCKPGSWLVDQWTESGKMSQAGYREQAHHPACASRQEEQECWGTQVEPPCILMYCIPVLCINMGVCLPEEQSKCSKSFNLKPATGCFLFAWSERGSCHPRTGKTNDRRAFPPSDLVKPPQIWVTKGFSEKPTCTNLSLKYFMPASPMPVDTSESPSPLPAGMDCMAPTNVVLYSCSLI